MQRFKMAFGVSQHYKRSRRFNQLEGELGGCRGIRQTIEQLEEIHSISLAMGKG